MKNRFHGLQINSKWNHGNGIMEINGNEWKPIIHFGIHQNMKYKYVLNINKWYVIFDFKYYVNSGCQVNDTNIAILYYT